MPVIAAAINAKQEKTTCPRQGWIQSRTVSKKNQASLRRWFGQ